MELFDIIGGDPVQSFPTLAARLALSALLGLVVGIEREIRRQPAGMRTHMLICVGAAVFTIISLHIPLYHLHIPFSRLPIEFRSDPARIAAQIVSGIGFLGAGAIIKFGTNVRGITTAASMWAVAAVGMAAGAGMPDLAISATVIILIVLVLFERFELRLFFIEHFKTIEVRCLPQTASVEVVRGAIARRYIRIRTVDYESDNVGGLSVMRFSVRISEQVPVQQLVDDILALPGVQGVRIDQERR